MPRWNRTTAPTWAPNAVPGTQGWYHPVTHELLVAIKMPLAVPTVAGTIAKVQIHRNQKKFQTGDVIRFLVYYNLNVVVTGAPRLPFTINGVAKNATYVSGTNSATVVFNYVVQAGDVATAGQVLVGVAGLASTLTSGASNSQLKLTAKTVGVAGNSITLAAVNPGTNNATLGVSVVSNAITVNLATNGSAVATSTVAQIIAAVVASVPASALVTATSGTGNGTGVFVAIASTALTGGTNTTANTVVLNGGTIVSRSNFATLTLGTVNSQILFTAVATRTYGNNVTVRIVNPGTNNAALAVSVVGKDITISLATNGSAVATSTSSLVIAAVNASVTAKTLVTASVGTGDGTGVVVVAVKTNLAGGIDTVSSTAATLTFTLPVLTTVTIN